MTNQCPKCQSADLSTDNPYGKLLCQSCGWMEDAGSHNLSFREMVINVGRWCLLVILVSFFAIMSLQFLRWKNFALEATLLQSKEIFGVAQERDRMELGTICNSLGKFKCSARTFMTVVKNNPSQRAALANLGMAYAHQKMWEKARPHFEAYFSLNGAAFDVMYWYAKTVNHLDGDEKALPWFYYSVSANPNFRESAVALVDVLVRKDRGLEALGAVGAVTHGQPERYPFWNQYLASLSQKFKIKKWPAQFELPSFDGQNHYVPTWLRDKGRVHFFVLSETEEVSWVDEDVLFENLISIPPHVEAKEYESREGPRSGKKIKLAQLQVGPLMLKEVEVVVCSDCRSLLGKEVLKEFRAKSNQRYQTRFLSLVDSNYKEKNEKAQ